MSAAELEHGRARPLRKPARNGRARGYHGLSGEFGMVANFRGGNEVFIMRIGRYQSSEGSNIGTAITFLLIGLGAGALAGLLLAPKSGKALRRDLKRGYDDAVDSVGEWADEAKDRVRDAGDRVRDAATRGVEMAEDLREAAREKVEPLRKAINRS